MLHDLIKVIHKILNKKIIEQDTKFRKDLKNIEENCLKSANKEVFGNNDTDKKSYKIPELEVYKDDTKNSSKVLILNI